MGGVRSWKWKVRSGRTVISAGMGVPGIICAVRALNSCEGEELSDERWGEVELETRAYFAKVDGFDALAAEGGADGGRGRGLAGADDELYDLLLCGELARHLWMVCGQEELWRLWC